MNLLHIFTMNFHMALMLVYMFNLNSIHLKIIDVYLSDEIMHNFYNSFHFLFFKDIIIYVILSR